MGVSDILFIGIGLSMDAFAVSICKGLKMKVVDLKQCLMIAWFFGIFQAIMPTIGYVLSSKFVEYINAYSHWVTFVLLTIIGANMIRESVGNEEEETSKRLEILNKSNDGFYIAGEDLKLRGPGDLFGIRQSGQLEFRIGDIYQDADMLKAASEAAGGLLELDRDLLLPQHEILRERLQAYMKYDLENLGL